MSRIFDSERVKRALETEHKEFKHRHPEISPEEIDLMTANTINELEKQTKFVTMPPFVKQRFLDPMGAHMVLRDMRREWAFYKAVTQIMNDDGEVDAIIRQKYGSNYPIMKQKMNNYGTLINTLKYHLDRLDNIRKDSQLYAKHNQEALKIIQKIPLTYEDLDKIFIIICQRTNLGQHTVSNQIIARLKQSYKKVEYADEERKQKTNLPGEGGDE